MGRFGLITIVVCLLTASGVWAAEPSPPTILTDIDTRPIIEGQPFTLTIQIETVGQGTPDVSLPRFGALRVLSQSVSHPMSFSFSFGFGSGSRSQTKRQSHYTFVLAADKPGRYKLDPVTVTVDGRKYKGKPLVLDVLSASGGGYKSAPQGGAGAIPSPAVPVDPDSNPAEEGSATIAGPQDLRGAKFDPDYFLQTHVSKENIVVGEAIVLSVYLYFAVSIADFEFVREPGTEGFWVENLLANQRRYQEETVEIGGQGFRRIELRKLMLFPIKPGKLTIAPALVELFVSRGSLFRPASSVKRASLPVEITVAPLPTAKQPDGYDPANVGKYTFASEVDNEKVRVGEPVTLKLTAKGIGNVRNLVLPAPDSIPGFKVYAPETEVDVQVQGDAVVGSRVNRILMIPTEEGTHTVPPIKWSFYDPQKGAYQTLEGKAHTIVVEKGNARLMVGDSPDPAAKEADAPGQDRLNRQLRSILSRADLDVDRSRMMMTRPWFLATALALPLIYLILVVVSRTRRKLAEADHKVRSKRADATARRRIAELRKQTSELSNEEFFAALEKLLIGFLEDRLQVPVTGDRLADLRNRLCDRGFSPEHADRVVTEMESADFARFARSSVDRDQRDQVLGRMDQLIRDLAKVRVTALPKEVKR